MDEPMHPHGGLVGPKFRWRRDEDGSGEAWSRWHSARGYCSACCCGILACSQCGGGRLHQEPGEPVSALDVVHIRHCQVCGEDPYGLGHGQEVEEADV